MKRLVAVLTVLCAIPLAGCGSQSTSGPDFEETVQARVKATLAAVTVVPSQATAVPVPTPLPTPAPVLTDQQKMAQSLDVRFVGMSYILKNPNVSRYSDMLGFTFEYENKSPKEIRAFTGVLTFMDLFDRPIKRIRLTCDDPIAAGQTLTDDGRTFEFNPFIDEDKRLAGMKSENLKVSFEHQSVLFTDGTQIGSAKP